MSILKPSASGIPVIATKAGGIPEHISDKLGIIIPPGDELNFAKAMEEMIHNYASYDVNYLRKYAIDHFSNEKIGEQFQQLYLKILNGNQ